MAAKVLDSWALLAFYTDEPAAAEVERLIEQAGNSSRPLFMSVVNWAEVAKGY